MIKDKRTKRDKHYLNNAGMVACNPRDKEAAHRAQVENIATESISEVNCKKCIPLIPKNMRKKSNP